MIRSFRNRMFACVVRILPLLLLVACESTSPSTPVTAEVRIISPAQAEGAVLVEMTGPMTDPTNAGPGELIARSRGDTLWVLVIMENPGEARFTVGLPNADSRISTRLLQVADGSNALRSSLAGYEVKVTR